jgi:ubiquinone/menaquinone biosynthesis C-methylase UbiE
LVTKTVNMTSDSLIPPDELLIDGPRSRQEFIDGGPGFLCNVLVPRTALQPHHAVLDIGSGNGRHARVLTEYLNSQGSYRGFDIVRNIVEWCQERYAPFPNFRFDFANVRSDWYNPDALISPETYTFPYSNEQFDIAYATSLFTHLEPDATTNYLRECARVLKPGGRLLVTSFLVNVYNSGKNTVQTVQGLKFKRLSPVHHVIDPEHRSRGVAYDESAFRKMISDTGLVVSELTFGTWANGVDVLSAVQDMVLSVKPY